MKKVRTWRDDFVGHRIYSATAASNVGHNWKVTKTAAAGTPTFAPLATERGLKVDMDAQNEVQNLCISFADLLAFDIDDIVEARFRLKMNQAALTTGSQLAFGLQGNRNDTIDSIAQHLSFRVIGADSTTLVVVESDDGTTDLDDKATGKTLINAYKDFTINFARGTSKVQFLIDGQPVANTVTFDMSAYTAGLQPYMQLQKAANTNADGFTILRAEVDYRE
jgi:hypothetical protein